MPVVSNTSPILNLAIIDKLFILRRQFDEILIPSGVVEELRIGEKQELIILNIGKGIVSTSKALFKPTTLDEVNIREKPKHWKIWKAR